MKRIIPTTVLIALSVVVAHCGGRESGDDSGRETPNDGGADVTETCHPACLPGQTCCNGRCVNPDNDPQNCGGCGIHCGGDDPYCDGSCKQAPCTRDGSRCDDGTCCGDACCADGEICCKYEGPIGGGSLCVASSSSQPTCPPGCAPNCVSDRDRKYGIAPVDERAVLESVMRMPIATWSYDTDPSSVRHLGPMAQDFHASLGLGSTDRAYDPIDAHGAAFAAIKALYGIVQEQNARISQLEEANRKLRGRTTTDARSHSKN